jgi:hypothetical protein
MQQFINNMGLNSLAVRTDLETLKTYEDCQIILHLPTINHYVVLGNTDNEYVRLIDLDKNNFYYRDRIEHFNRIWEGTALIVSDGPIAVKNCFAKIDNNQLRGIIGADNCQTCTDPIQSSANFPCPDPVAGTCGGSHVTYYKRLGCEPGSSGDCKESDKLGSTSTPCGDDPFDPEACIGVGDPTSYYISACE